MSRTAIRNVGEIMTGDLVTLSPMDSMARAKDFLDRSGLHAIPIVEHGQPFGMVTLADCNGRQPDELLGDVMAGPPVTIDVKGSVSAAASLMRQHYVHHLLVTEGANAEVVGILSSYDLLAGLID
ncbi:MAG: CBS domain-containing protein [Acidimicrobiales bacterium]